MKSPFFKKNSSKKTLPVHSVCRNCGTQLIARYCHNCGQDLFAGSERTVGEILYSTLDTIFAWDNKILKTLKLLFFYPGKLTKDFFSGKVIQYVYPAKLFWFITILFFAVLNVEGLIDQSSDDSIMTVNIDEEVVYKQKEIDNIKQTQNIRSNYIKNFANYIPYVTLLLIPFFAFLLFIFFYKKKSYYASHMIFALHFHSFVFLLLTAYILIKDFIPASWEDSHYLLFILPVIYFIIALYVAYRPSIIKLLWKVPLIMLNYAIISFTVFILFIILVARIVEITNGIKIFD